MRLPGSNIAALGMVFISVFVLAGTFSVLETNFHQVVMWKPAVDISRGRALFRETFTMYGALTTYLQALAVRIFGYRLVVIQLMTAFTYALTGMLLWFLWSYLLPRWWAAAACLIWILLARFYLAALLPWSSVYALFFQILSAVITIRFLTTKNRLYLLLAGSSVSAAFWCRQPVGVFLFAAIFFFLLFRAVIDKNNPVMDLLFFAGGFALITIIFLLWLMYNNSLTDFYLQSFVYPSKWTQMKHFSPNFQHIISSLFPFSESSNPGFDLFRLGDREIIWIILPISSLALLVWTLFQVLKKKGRVKRKEDILLLILFISLASWSQYYPLASDSHTFWAATPMVGLFIYLIRETLKPLPRFGRAIKNLLMVIIILVAFAPPIYGRMKTGLWRLRTISEDLQVPASLIGMKIKKENVGRYRGIYYSLWEYLEKNPGVKIIVPEYGDTLYLLLVTPDRFGSFHQLYNDYNYGRAQRWIYPDYYGKLQKYIRENNPLIITSRPDKYLRNHEGYHVLNHSEEKRKILVPADK